MARSRSEPFESEPEPYRPGMSEADSRRSLSKPLAGVSKSDLVVKHQSGSFLADRFQTVCRLGSGSFGTVDLVRDCRSGIERVCKHVPIRGMKPATLALMKKEITLLQELDHPRIVKLFEYAEDAKAAMLHLLLEHLPGGDGESLLANGARPPEALVARLIQQVLSATAYCHKRGIVHCDLKPENLILTAVPRAPGRCRRGLFAEVVDCKVIDFGLAAHFVHSEPDSIQQVAGTPAYIAPEVVGAIRGGAFGPKADVWSIGVTAYRLLTSKFPFGHHGIDYGGDFWQVFNNVKAFKGVDFTQGEWDGRSEHACGFVEDLMCVDARQRPTVVEALTHPWFENHTSVQHKKIRRTVLRSLRDYAKSQLYVRICLLLIASRASSRELRMSRRAFMRLDVDGSGVLTLEVFQEAIAHPGGFCPYCCYPQVDAEEIFKAVNLSRSGVIEYTEFAAACLYSTLGSTSGRELAGQAFHAVDGDQDGLVTAEDVVAFFPSPEQAEPLAEMLPPDRPFDENAFYMCLKRGRPPKLNWCPQCPYKVSCGVDKGEFEVVSDDSLSSP